MPELTLYYDGECPICKQYTLFLKIKKTHHLIIKNARDALELKAICQNNGLNINKGIILITEKGEILHAQKALLYLKNIDTNQNIFYKILFSRQLIGIVYPFLKTIRMILLKILGKDTKIF